MLKFRFYQRIISKGMIFQRVELNFITVLITTNDFKLRCRDRHTRLVIRMLSPPFVYCSNQLRAKELNSQFFRMFNLSYLLGRGVKRGEGGGSLPPP